MFCFVEHLLSDLQNCEIMKTKAINQAPVNQQVKLLVKKKMQKFISTESPCPHVTKANLAKSIDLRDHKRRDNILHKKPVWETWGTDEYDPGNIIGIFGQKEIFGNNFEGQEWIEEQKRRQKQFMFNPGEIKTIPAENVKQDQFIYIEPSISEAYLQKLRKVGYQFEDPNFLPNDASLNGDHAPQPQWEVIKWKKIRYMLNNSIIFQGKIQPNDIKQGFLGNCYFLAGLAALAQRPDRVFNLFLLKQKNQLNYYSVKMLFRGKWRIIDVDDSIPFVFGTPAFSKSNKDQLWVILLEKAWAKLYGSYKQIEAGFPEEVLHDLTGAPIKQLHLTHKSKKTDEQWKYLMEASLKQYAMVASSNIDSIEPISPTGIFQGHAYTFLNATQIQIKDKKQRIVQLRNTWGRGQYKGKQKDDDPIWDEVSEQQKYRVHYLKDCDDGVFFMAYDDFTEEFRVLTMAQINDNASYVYESNYDPDKKGVYFTLKIVHEGNYSLQVDKTPQRYFIGQKQRRYRYPEARLQIGRINASSSEMLEGYTESKRCMYRSYQLFPGQYVVYVKIDFDPKFQEEYQVNLAVYSDYSCGVTISTTQDVFKLTGKKNNDWEGVKRKRPNEKVSPIQMKSMPHINYPSDQKIAPSQNLRNSVKILIHNINQSGKITQSQIDNVNKTPVKPYRYQTQFERKNQFVMFGLQTILIEQTPCYQEAIGQLRSNWNSKEKAQKKSVSKSKSKQKIKQNIINNNNIKIQQSKKQINKEIKINENQKTYEDQLKKKHISQQKPKQRSQSPEKYDDTSIQDSRIYSLRNIKENQSKQNKSICQSQISQINQNTLITPSKEIKQSQKKQEVKNFIKLKIKQLQKKIFNRHQKSVQPKEKINTNKQKELAEKQQIQTNKKEEAQKYQQSKAQNILAQTKKYKEKQKKNREKDKEEIKNNQYNLAKNKQKQLKTSQIKGKKLQQSCKIKEKKPYLQDLMLNILSGHSHEQIKQQKNPKKQHINKSEKNFNGLVQDTKNVYIKQQQKNDEIKDKDKKVKENRTVQNKQKSEQYKQDKKTSNQNQEKDVILKGQIENNLGENKNRHQFSASQSIDKQVRQRSLSQKSEKTKQRIKEELKKRRRKKDILKYEDNENVKKQQQEKTRCNILFDLWPKLKY